MGNSLIKKSIMVCIAVSVLFCTVGCGTSKKPVLFLKHSGKTKIVKHIKEKYEMTPKIKNIKAEWGDGAVMNGGLPRLSDIGPDGTLTATVKLGEMEFVASTRGDKDDGLVYDDLERDMITYDLEQDIEERLGIKSIGCFIEYLDTETYGMGHNQYYRMRKKYKEPVSFYNQCHTKFFVGTQDEIDESLIRELSEAYKVESDLAYLSLNIIQFDDTVYYVNGERTYIYPKYIIDNEHVLDFYAIEKSGSYSKDIIKHRDEVIKE